MAVFRTLPRRRRRHHLIILTILIAYTLWAELFSLHFKALLWKYPQKTDNSVRLLLVADPQLIGYRNEKEWIGWLTRWDSDRYMNRAFTKAYSSIQPEFTIFLGDIFDEGVQMRSSPKEFEWTLNRFHSVFPISNQTNQIYIAGDNDIGGEMEHVSSELQDRFDRSFPNHLKGNKASGMFEFSEINIFDDLKVHKISEGNGLKILVSHVPVIRSIPSLEQTFGNYRPDLILSAHDHTAEFYVKKPHSVPFSRHEASKGLRFSVSTGMPLVEIQVPTISYRMGVPSMALGLLQIDVGPKGHSFSVSYETLWLPGRYPQLYGYVFVLLIIVCHSFGEYLKPVWKLLKIDRVVRRCKSGQGVQKYVPV